MAIRAWNRLRDPTLPRRQRLEMYMVISMPKRRSIARGISHFMMLSFQFK